MARNLQNWCKRTHWNGWFSFIFSVDEHVLSIANKIIIFYWQDIRSFFSPKGKTSKPGASKVEDKRGKDSRAKPASKDPGKGRAKSKVIYIHCIFRFRFLVDTVEWIVNYEYGQLIEKLWIQRVLLRFEFEMWRKHPVLLAWKFAFLFYCMPAFHPNPHPHPIERLRVEEIFAHKQMPR